MSLQTIRQLDESNSDVFISHAGPKHAVLRWEPRRYELSWGTQEFDGPHMVVIEPDHEYGVDLEVFFTTHRPIPDRKDYYQKHVRVRAVQAKEDTRIVTEVDGRVEMEAVVPAGAWIIQNPAGEIYYNSAEDFEARYERARPE
jgi:hypothetical protein